MAIPGAAPSVANSSLPLALGLAATLISFLILEILLIAVAFGAADYDRGLPGLSTGTFKFYSAVAMAFSCGLGATVAAGQLRRADVDERAARQLALLAPGLVALGIAINGTAAGSGLRGPLVIALGAAPATVLGARLGSRTKGPR